MMGSTHVGREGRHRRRLALAMAVAALGLAACGEETGTSASSDPEATSQHVAGEGEAILIKTRLTLPDGEVLDGSVIGDSPFCPGGTFHDEHGTGEFLVLKTFECPGGTIEIGFSPTERSLKQSSLWKVLDGTGDFEGMSGHGEMSAKFDRAEPSSGQETFTGTVVR